MYTILIWFISLYLFLLAFPYIFIFLVWVIGGPIFLLKEGLIKLGNSKLLNRVPPTTLVMKIGQSKIDKFMEKYGSKIITIISLMIVGWFILVWSL